MPFLGGLLGNGLGTYDQPGTGLLGKLGTNLRGENPLFNLTMGYLSQLGPSREPSSPFQRLGRAGVYASEAQQQAMQNQYLREKIKASQAETTARGEIAKLLFGGGTGGDAGGGTAASGGGDAGGGDAGGGDAGIAGASNPMFAGNDPRLVAASFALDPGGTITKLIQPPQTPEQRAQAAAGFPDIKAAADKYEQGQQQTKIEGVAANDSITNMSEAEDVLTRLSAKGSPVIPGSSAAKKLWDMSLDENGLFHSVSPADFAKIAGKFTGGAKLSEEQLQQFQTDWNRFGKLSNKAIMEERQLEAQYSAAGGTQGRLSNFGLGFIQGSNINPGVDINSNRAILRDNLRKQLGVAGIRGWDLPQRATGEGLIKKWDAILDPNKAVPYNVPPPAGTEAPATGLLERGADIGSRALNKGLDFLDRSLTDQPDAAPAPIAPPTVGRGVQNGQIVPQPSPVYSPLSPSTASAETRPAPAPAPAARKTGTLKYNAQGVPTFNRLSDLKRAETAGWLQGVTSVVVNGKTFDWVP